MKNGQEIGDFLWLNLLLHSVHRAEEKGKNKLLRGLDGIRKAGIVTDGPGVPGIAGSGQGHHSRVEGSLPSGRSSEGKK